MQETQYLNRLQVEALLGRSLSNKEVSNFNLYLAIAITRLEDLLCVDLPSLLNELNKEVLPVDLQLVLARFFGSLSSENSVELGVETKHVEDFSISYNDDVNKQFALVVQANNSTILKYSKCVAIRHGRTIREDCRYYDNIR